MGIDHFRAHYRLASHNVHGNPKGVFCKLGILGEEELLLTGSSNAGLADPGQNTAISLMHATTPIGVLSPDMDCVVTMKVMQLMVDDARNAFHAASCQLEVDARA